MKKKVIAAMLTLCLLIAAVPLQAASGIPITYNKKDYMYTQKQLKVQCNNRNVDISKTVGLLENGYALLPYHEVFKSALNVSSIYNSNTRILTFKYDGNQVDLYVDKKTAVVNGKKTTTPVSARFVKFRNSNVTRLMVPSRFVAENLGLIYSYNSVNATVSINMKANAGALTGINLFYDGAQKNYQDTQYQIYTGSKKVSTAIPGIIINDTAFVPANAVFGKGTLGTSYQYSGGTMTLKKGNDIVVLKKDNKTALVNGTEVQLKEPMRIIRLMSNGKNYVMAPAKAVAEAFGVAFTTNKTKKTMTFTLSSNIPDNKDDEEMKAMWVSYLEFGSTKKTEAQWKTKIDEMFDDCVDYGMNTIIFQVRPFGDAMYPSEYFPWSKYASGTQGTSLGYDPFAYAVKAAHARGLKIEAWINPYRVASNSTDVTKLSKDNPARIYRNTKGKERYVLSFGNNMYYNPAMKEVQQLIVDGVQEILDNYDVDGIHLDDYFYPTLGSKYKTVFDATEYNQSGSKLSIANWRRQNVNTLVKALYDTVKAKDSSIRFGISPAGNPSNLTNDQQYYVDIDTWLTEEGYVDYICPQIYWNFDHPVAAYDKMVDKWIDLNKAEIADLYIGIAVYKAGYHVGTNDDWQGDGKILANQIEYGRESDKVQGYMFFRFDSFKNSVAQTEVKNLVKLLK